jgi:hypothetical protein
VWNHPRQQRFDPKILLIRIVQTIEALASCQPRGVAGLAARAEEIAGPRAIPHDPANREFCEQYMCVRLDVHPAVLGVRSTVDELVASVTAPARSGPGGRS